MVKLYKNLGLIILCLMAFNSVASNLNLNKNANLKIKLGTKEILINNDKVEMVRLTYSAGTESGFHSHEFSFRTVYVVSAGKLALISKNIDIPNKVIDLRVGQALYLPATTHNVKNVGETEIILVETEIK